MPPPHQPGWVSHPHPTHAPSPHPQTYVLVTPAVLPVRCSVSRLVSKSSQSTTPLKPGAVLSRSCSAICWADRPGKPVASQRCQSTSEVVCCMGTRTASWTDHVLLLATSSSCPMEPPSSECVPWLDDPSIDMITISTSEKCSQSLG